MPPIYIYILVVLMIAVISTYLFLVVCVESIGVIRMERRGLTKSWEEKRNGASWKISRVRPLIAIDERGVVVFLELGSGRRRSYMGRKGEGRE